MTTIIIIIIIIIIGIVCYMCICVYVYKYIYIYIYINIHIYIYISYGDLAITSHTIIPEMQTLHQLGFQKNILELSKNTLPEG